MAVIIDNLNANILSIKSSKNSTWYSTSKVFNIQELVKDIVPSGAKLTKIRIKIVNTRTGTSNLNMTSGRIDSFKLQKETRDSIELEFSLDNVNKLIELHAYEDINSRLPNNEFFDVLDGTHIHLKISAQGYISSRVWYDTTTNAYLTGVTYEKESSGIQTSLEAGTTRKSSVDSIITNKTDRRKVVGVVKKNKGLRTTIITFKNEVKLNRNIYKVLCKDADVKRKKISNYVSKYTAYRKSVIDLEAIYLLGRKVTSDFNDKLMLIRSVVNDNTLVKSVLKKVTLDKKIISKAERKTIKFANKKAWISRKTVSNDAIIKALIRRLTTSKNNNFNTRRVNAKVENKENRFNRNIGINDIVSTKLRRYAIAESSATRPVKRIAIKETHTINSTLRLRLVLSKNVKGTIRKNIANYKVNSAVKRTSILESLESYNSTRTISVDKTISSKSIRSIAVNSATKASMDRIVFANRILKASTNRPAVANKSILRHTAREIIDGHLSIRTTGDAYGYSGQTYFSFISGTSSTTRFELFNADGTLINKIYESSLISKGTADLDSTFSTITNVCMIRYNLRRSGVATSVFESNFYQNSYALNGAFKNAVYVLPLEASEDKARFFVLRAIADTDKAEMIIADSYVEVDITRGTMKQSSVVTNKDTSMKFAISTTKAPTYKIVGYKRNEIILDFNGCNDFIVINTKTNVFRRMQRVNISLDTTLCKSSNGYKQVSIERPTSSTKVEVKFVESGKVIAIEAGAANISPGRIMYDASIDKYYFTQTVRLDNINYLKKYIMDINQEEIISEEVLEERGRNSSQTEIAGLLGGGLGYPGNRYLYIPYLIDEEFDGKIHVLYRALLKRSSHIDSKPNFNIRRYITNSKSLTGHLNKTVHVSDEVIKMVARKTLKDNDNRVDTRRNIRLDLETYFSNHRETLKDTLVAGPTSRRITEANVIVKKFNSSRMILIDAIKHNPTSRMATIQSETMARANRNTLIDRIIVGPTTRAVIDINITIYRVDTSRKIIANNINAKPLVRSSHLNVEDQLNTKRSISTSTSLNEHTKRSVGCSNFINGDIHRSVIEGEVKTFNTERKAIANYNRVANTDRRISIINNITGSTERTVVIGNSSNYRTQRKTRALIINDYKTLRVVTLRATDSKVYYFNAIVPITIDEYPIYTFNTKLGMDFN